MTSFLILSVTFVSQKKCFWSLLAIFVICCAAKKREKFWKVMILKKLQKSFQLCCCSKEFCLCPQWSCTQISKFLLEKGPCLSPSVDGRSYFKFHKGSNFWKGTKTLGHLPKHNAYTWALFKFNFPLCTANFQWSLCFS